LSKYKYLQYREKLKEELLNKNFLRNHDYLGGIRRGNLGNLLKYGFYIFKEYQQHTHTQIEI